MRADTLGAHVQLQFGMQIVKFGKSKLKFLKEFERNFVSLIPKVDFYVILCHFFQNTKMNNFS
jgi:hypothetical protein